MNESGRQQKQVNLKKARTVALLYYLPDEQTYVAVESIISKLNELNLKVRVVCYTDLKITPYYFIPKISQDIITVKDIDWKYQPKKPFVKEFVETEFDILIDLSLNDYLPLVYCAALSQAGLKVGRFQEDHELFYDLMIQAGPEETVESFSMQVIHYLSRINN